jgi:hypothetical protein
MRSFGSRGRTDESARVQARDSWKASISRRGPLFVCVKDRLAGWGGKLRTSAFRNQIRRCRSPPETFFGNDVRHDNLQSRCSCSTIAAPARQPFSVGCSGAPRTNRRAARRDESGDSAHHDRPALRHSRRNPANAFTQCGRALPQAPSGIDGLRARRRTRNRAPVAKVMAVMG